MKKAIRIILDLMRKPIVWFSLKIKKVKFKKTPVINGRIYIKNKGLTKIGKNVVINSSVRSNCTSGNKTCLFVMKNAKLIINDNCGLSNARIIVSEHIEIGKNVLIGAGCRIYDTDFHPLDFEDRVNNRTEKIKHSPVIIQDGVFIGADVIVLKGVTIGERSIIGAGSVVTKSIPARQIWAGNPAKYIRDVIDKK